MYHCYTQITIHKLCTGGGHLLRENNPFVHARNAKTTSGRLCVIERGWYYVRLADRSLDMSSPP